MVTTTTDFYIPVSMTTKHHIAFLALYHPEMWTLNTVLGTIEIISAVFGLILNTLSLVFFIRRDKQATNTMYILMIATDILICIVCLPSGVAMVKHGEAGILQDKGVCTMFGVAYFVASRISIFLIAVLSTARTLSLMAPFSKISWCTYASVIMSYLAGTIICGILPLFSHSPTPILSTDSDVTTMPPLPVLNATTVTIDSMMSTASLSPATTVAKAGYNFNIFFFCTFKTAELSFVSEENSVEYVTITLLVEILPWLIPGLVVCVSCFLSVYAICWSKGTLTGTQDRKKYATMTILIVTVVCIFFNVPLWAMSIINLLELKYQNIMSSDTNIVAVLYIQICVYRISVVLNSFANPIVYFWRIKQMRAMYLRCGREKFADTYSSVRTTVMRGISWSYYSRQNTAASQDNSFLRLPQIKQ